jgi:hypothetical protein
MTVNTQKQVRVLAGPTGPTGTVEGVRILSTFTGPTGTFPVWGQINAAQQAQSPTGTFKSVYPRTPPLSPTGTIKTVIIPGFTGPA